jgi:glycine cleavage system H protein
VVALFVVTMILAALTADYFVVRFARPRPAMNLARREHAGSHEVPAGFFLDLSHMWVEPEASGCLRIGTDAFATSLLGKPDKVVLQVEAGPIARGAPLAVLTVADRALTLRSPVDGEIVEHNLAVTDRPEAIQDDPFRAGWLSRLRPADGAADLKHMRSGDRAAAWLGEESKRLRSFMMSRLGQTETVGATMADGGTIAPGMGVSLDDKSWHQLECEFYGRPLMTDEPGPQAAGDKRELS